MAAMASIRAGSLKLRALSSRRTLPSRRASTHTVRGERPRNTPRPFPTFKHEDYWLVAAAQRVAAERLYPEIQTFMEDLVASSLMTGALLAECDDCCGERVSDEVVPTASTGSPPNQVTATEGR